MPLTQTLATPRPAARSANTLVEIGERLKRAARARPDTMVQPPQPLANKAKLAMVYYRAEKRFFLRIARKGLSPLNDFSTPSETRIGGAARLKRWQTEIKTFRRDLGVPPDAEQYDGAEGLFYWVDLYWKENE
jgi:hypothetical protein